LGPLALSFFLAEIAAGADLRETLARYAQLDPDTVRNIGAADGGMSATLTALRYQALREGE
jgi:hypothetical protein